MMTKNMRKIADDIASVMARKGVDSIEFAGPVVLSGARCAVKRLYSSLNADTDEGSMNLPTELESVRDWQTLKRVVRMTFGGAR